MLADVEDKEGKTVLMRVLEQYNFELATKLVRRGADINSVNKEGKTALTVFLLAHRAPIVEYLLKNGADPHIADLSGRDSCDYAKLNNILMFPELLKSEPSQKKYAKVSERTSLEEAQNAVLKKVNDAVTLGRSIETERQIPENLSR